MPLPRPTLARETAVWAEANLLVGVDEVGRGPLAGPVVAAAVVFSPEAKRIRGVRDSKMLTEARREILAKIVRQRALCIGLGAASTREIDRLNIRVATALAMRRAILRVFAGGLECRPAQQCGHTEYRIILDGLPMPEIGFPHEALVDGDALCYSIAAAGIVAKTVRDALMLRLARRYPSYGWEHNKGYCTPDHCSVLLRIGPTRHHRQSFEPVAQLTLDLTLPDARADQSARPVDNSLVYTD